ncbi:MAG: 3'-5' exonuclease [Porphyromonas sp.]|uniref:3'-5' exonuclease n=1 Tax=Porphyromonas sp. TaxID=1924944 RepID=UPI002A910A5C|nr:3'-5' exonuclease [Porphyromonas sp.]MDD7468095.1 3'-5' exonuclease [Bacteroidales bacterium]MDY6102457.1 3'-5' exonuclease [Porphyromonas sp.]
MSLSGVLIIIAVVLVILLLGDIVLRRVQRRAHTGNTKPLLSMTTHSIDYKDLLKQLQPPTIPADELAELREKDPELYPRYLILDLQTTGLSIEPGREDRIVQAAWLGLDDRYRELCHGVALVDQPDAGSEEAMRVHHLDTHTLRIMGKSEVELIETLLPLIKHSSVIVCHNVRFDLSILLATLRRLHPTAEYWLKHKEAICTMVLSAALDPHGRHRYRSLKALTNEYTGISPDDMEVLDIVGWRNVCLTRICLAQLRLRHPDETEPGDLPIVEDYLDRRVGD